MNVTPKDELKGKTSQVSMAPKSEETNGRLTEVHVSTLMRSNLRTKIVEKK